MSTNMNTQTHTQNTMVFTVHFYRYACLCTFLFVQLLSFELLGSNKAEHRNRYAVHTKQTLDQPKPRTHSMPCVYIEVYLNLYACIRSSLRLCSCINLLDFVFHFILSVSFVTIVAVQRDEYAYCSFLFHLQTFYQSISIFEKRCSGIGVILQISTKLDFIFLYVNTFSPFAYIQMIMKLN